MWQHLQKHHKKSLGSFSALRTKVVKRGTETGAEKWHHIGDPFSDVKGAFMQQDFALVLVISIHELLTNTEGAKYVLFISLLKF